MAASRPSLSIVMIIAVLFLAGGGALLEYRSFRIQRDGALTRIRQEAQTLAQAEGATFGAVDTALRAVVAEAEERVAAGQPDNGDLATQLQSLADALPHVMGLGVTDADGAVLMGRLRSTLSKPSLPMEFTVRDRPYFRWFAQGPGRDEPDPPPFLGQPLRSRLDGSWFLGMSRPMRAPDGAFAGIAMAAFALDGFDTGTLAASAPDQVTAVLVGPQGMVVEASLPGVDSTQAVGRPLELLLADYDLDDLRRQAAATREPRVAAMGVGMAAVAVVPGTPYQVVVVQPWEVVLSGWRRSLVNDLGLLVVALLGLLTLAVPLVRAVRDRDRLFELSPDPICVCDREGRILRLNRAWTKVLGLPESDLIGNTHANLVHPDDVEGVLWAQALLLAGEAVTDQSLRYETADGGDCWLSWSAVAEGDRLYVLARDITQRREAEQALRASEQRFRDVSEAASEFIWETDGTGRLTFASRRIRSVLGVGPDEVRGCPLLDLLTEAGRRKIEPILGRRAPFVVEVPVVRGTGEAWLRLSGQPILDGQASSRATGGHAYRGAAQDVSEARQARQALQDSEARYRGIVNTIVDAIFTVDERGTICSVNPAAERLFGYAAREMIARNVGMLMPEPHRSRHDSYLREYMRTGLARVIGTEREVNARRKDGSLFPMELGLSEVFLNGERYFIGACRDVSERKRIERLKDEFVATVSHELRTPLTSIRGSLGLVVGGAVGPIPEKATKLIGVAMDNCQRLARLVDDILDIERIESGLLPFRMERLDLRTVIEKAVADLAPGFTEQMVHPVVDLVVSGPVMVRGDGDRLLQLLSNLLANAIAFSPRDGYVRVTLYTEDGAAVVSVSDEGPGIAADFRDRVFQRFSQADGSTTRSRGGSGLGLAIVQAIAARHNGHVGFITSTEPPTGTSFTFRMPLEGPWHGGETHDR